MKNIQLVSEVLKLFLILFSKTEFSDDLFWYKLYGMFNVSMGKSILYNLESVLLFGRYLFFNYLFLHILILKLIFHNIYRCNDIVNCECQYIKHICKYTYLYSHIYTLSKYRQLDIMFYMQLVIVLPFFSILIVFECPVRVE